MKYTEEHIDAYIRGELTSSERDVFEADLEHDSKLNREVDMIRLIVSGLNNRKIKKETISKWQKEVDNMALRKATSFRPWAPWVTAFSVAAAIIVGVFLFHPVFTPSLSVPQGGTEISMPSTTRSMGFYEIDSLIEHDDIQGALKAIDAEIEENESLLQENMRIRDEADSNVKKYEYVLRLLNEKKRSLLNKE